MLAVLMLRGPQTPGELLQRTERLYHFDGSPELHAVLERLIERELVVRLDRRPGPARGALRAPARRRGAGGGGDGGSAATRSRRPAGRLEREVADLRAQLQELREAIGA